MAFEITLDKLVYGGDALGYHQGRAVFVPRALPGERWEVELAHEAKRWFDLVRRDAEQGQQGSWATSLHDHDPNAWVMQPIADYKKRWPVPQAERDLSPSLTQNPGY